MRTDTFTASDIVSYLLRDFEESSRVLDNRFEQNFAKTMLATANIKNQNSNQHRTTTQVIDNNTTTSVIDHQLNRYQSEYNDLPNKMRHYG